VLRLIVLFFENRKPLAVYEAEVFLCALCDGGVGLRLSMMRVTDVNTYRASTSSASHTTIIALNVVDPSVRHPIWFRFVEHCALDRASNRNRLITLGFVRHSCADLSLFISYYLYLGRSIPDG
jgi:hypothetical protein